MLRGCADYQQNVTLTAGPPCLILSSMDIKTFLRNPVVAWADHKKRREFKLELLALMKQKAAAMERGIQFEGVSLDNPTPEHATILLVLRDIVNEDRQYSIVQWTGGISLVRTGQVDTLDQAQQDVNVKSNFIIRGGSEQAEDLFNHAATPMGTITGDKG